MLSNLPLKALAVMLALLLWLHVATDKVYEVEETLPVSVVLTPENRALAVAPPDSVRVRLSATGKTFLRSGWRRKGVALRLSESRIGTRESDLTTGNVTMADGADIALLDILSPRNYRFTLDVVDSAVLPVRSRITITPASGFAVGSADSIAPAMVKAIGPKSAIQRLKYAVTENQALDDVSSDFNLNVALDTSLVYGVRFVPNHVSYHVNVTAVRQKLLDSVSVALLNAPEAHTVIQPGFVGVIVSGPLKEAQQLTAGDVSVTVDYLARDASGYAPITVSLPASLKLISVSDSLVRLLSN